MKKLFFVEVDFDESQSVVRSRIEEYEIDKRGRINYDDPSRVGYYDVVLVVEDRVMVSRNGGLEEGSEPTEELGRIGTTKSEEGEIEFWTDDKQRAEWFADALCTFGNLMVTHGKELTRQRVSNVLSELFDPPAPSVPK